MEQALAINEQELLRRIAAKLTPEKRGVAVVKYNREFARFQAEHDPLYKALKSLYVELTRPYRDVVIKEDQLPRSSRTSHVLIET